jgi:hypothetical protein
MKYFTLCVLAIFPVRKTELHLGLLGQLASSFIAQQWMDGAMNAGCLCGKKKGRICTTICDFHH